MNWLRNFMAGRYGPDHLTLALLVVSFILSFVLFWIPVPFLGLLSYIPLGFALFRMLSRNILKRGEENIKFLKVWNTIRGWFRKTKQHHADRKIYHFTACPSCKQKIRLPKGRGKLRVTCPKCGHQFERKT